MLGLLRGSLPVREIAAELSLSPNTIKGYIRAIYCKLGVSTRAAAITPGARTGILPLRGQGQLHKACSGLGSWSAQVSA